MLEMYDEKKKKEELEKKDKVSDMMTKSSMKKEDEKEEEKPDMRSKYAMINLIKNKLRAAGQRDPMVMAVDACEEVVNEDEKKKIENAIKTKTMNGKPLTDKQIEGLDAGLTQGGNPSVLNKKKVNKVDEGAYETVKKVLDRGTEFVEKNPVGKFLGNIVKPVKDNKGKNYPTKKQYQDKKLK
jgi:hypothetical protein